jgi:hypothetical protein
MEDAVAPKLGNFRPLARVEKIRHLGYLIGYLQGYLQGYLIGYLTEMRKVP